MLIADAAVGKPDLSLKIDEELRKQLPSDTVKRMTIRLQRVQAVVDQIHIIRRYLN